MFQLNSDQIETMSNNLSYQKYEQAWGAKTFRPTDVTKGMNRMEFVNLTVQNHVGIVTIDRPPVNAVNRQLYKEIMDTFRSINEIDEIRVAILRAEGKTFVAGNDVKDLQQLNKDNGMEYRDMVKDSLGSVYQCRVPVIGAINGLAFGAGLGYAAGCDILIASEEAAFGIPEIKVGIVGGAQWLSLLVPGKVVRFMALTGCSLKAQELKQYGAVYKVVPGEKLMEAATEVANLLMTNSPIMLRYWKEALNINANARLAEKYDVEADFTGKYLETEDFQETLTAFLEKRKPVFKGK